MYNSVLLYHLNFVKGVKYILKDNEATINESEYYFATIVPIRLTVVTRSLLEFYFVEWALFYFICKCTSAIIRNNGTAEFTFYLNKRLEITNSASCDSFNMILVLKLIFLVFLIISGGEKLINSLKFSKY